MSSIGLSPGGEKKRRKDMWQLLIKLLPADKKALVELAFRITSSLDTPEERKRVIDYGIEMLADGKISVTEWTRFGKMAGVFKKGK
jgi:hypothetical protein